MGQSNYQSVINQIEILIDNPQIYNQFYQRLKYRYFQSSEEVTNDLIRLLGRRRGAELGGKLNIYLVNGRIPQENSVDYLIRSAREDSAQAQNKRYFKALKKKYQSLLWQIKELVLDEQQFESFQDSIPKFKTQQDLIQNLTGLIGYFRAEKHGKDLFQKRKKLNQSKQDQGVLQELQDKIKNDAKFLALKNKIHDCNFVEDLVDQFQNYMSKPQAESMAKRVFQEMGKRLRSPDYITYIEKDLSKRKVDGTTIAKINYLISRGKKVAVQRILIQVLGQVGGNQIFAKFQDKIPMVVSAPIEGSRKLFQQNGLQFFQYKQQLIESQKLAAKTLIVFGETGCGKSTFLNAICNYLANVEMEDPFRYKIIIENEDNQKAAITQEITSYYIRNSRTSTVYRLIDTPGLGDTRGIEKDKQIVEQVKHTFRKEIDSIHNILFVMKASTTRVTQYQQYVFQSIMDLFNRDIAPNFVFIFTFSDSGRPQVLQSVKDRQYGFGNYWDQIQQPKYLQVNNCGIFEKIDICDKIKMGYWEIGMKCMQKLFEKVDKIIPKSIFLSRDLLHKKESLANKIRNTKQTIENAIMKRENLFKEIQKVIEYQDDIDNNKNFAYEVDENDYYSEETKSNITRCINCLDSNCHIDCEFGDGEDKKNCCAFDTDGKCAVCPGKCHYTLHKNDHIIRKTRVVKKKRENTVNKIKYENLCKEMKTSEAIVKQLIQNIEVEVKTVIEATKEMVSLQKELILNQMSDKKPETTISYLRHLIANEQRDRKPGYEGRVKNMNEIIQEMKFYYSISKDSPEEMENKIKGFQQNQFKQLISKAKPGLIEKIFGNFFK